MTIIDFFTSRVGRTGAIALCAAMIMAGVSIFPACEQPTTPNTPNITPPPQDLTDQHSAPAPTPTPGSDTKPLDGSDIKKPDNLALKRDSLIYRIYTDEREEDEFVELMEFSTECKGIGDIFANNRVALNPTSYNEIIIPIDRVEYLRFNRRGLVGKRITGVGTIDQPVAFRDCPLKLRKPDEMLEGILVICRDLKGKTVEGEEWSLQLNHENSKYFNKIELLHPQ